MKQLLLHMLLLLLALATSCNIDGELRECPYNARLEYWYTGTGGANVLPDYVSSMQEFIFDKNEVLRQVNRRVGNKNVRYGEFTLPPGDYTLVSWANMMDTCSRVNEAVIGRTHLADMRLSLDRPYRPATSPASASAVSATGRAAGEEGGAPPPQGNAERLYYGFGSFSVAAMGVSRQRIDMLHSHLRLNVRVKWSGRPPANTNNFAMTLRGVPSGYTFAPGVMLKNTSYIIPGIEPERVDHRIDVQMEITGSTTGEFVTYRLTNDCHPLFCLYAGDKAMIREIDLSKFFRTMQINLDENLRQDFDLVVEVDASGGILVSTAVVADWENGGNIGGFM